MGKRGPEKGWLDARIKAERDSAYTLGKESGFQRGFKAGTAVKAIIVGVVCTLVLKFTGMAWDWAHTDLVAGGTGAASATASFLWSSRAA